MITTYDDFLQALSQYGFMPLSGHLPIVTLSTLTDPDSWFSENAQASPWTWRMRLCSRKDGAYARVLFGKPTLISPAWYGVFRRAFENPRGIEERYACGECDPLTRRMNALFDVRPVWPRYALLSEMGRGEIKESRFDRALAFLEHEMRVTVSGEAYKISRSGTPYGWPCAEYTRADAFTPPEWDAYTLTRAAAREKIVQKVLETAPQLDAKTLARMLGA
jgi:hypothetical protein